MIDLVKLRISAGDGGDGRVSFRRAKFVPKGGPDGGDGGDGGSVYLVGNKNHSTLQLFAGKTAFSAEDGEQGRAQKSYGKKGEDLYLEVPVGTVVWKLLEEVNLKAPKLTDEDFSEEQLVARHEDITKLRLQHIQKEKVVEVLEHGQVVLLCKGGKGGRGNERFKSSTNTTPMEAEKGTPGEAMDVFFELKLLADVGLVGFPNAGKSTFLSLVTKANPRIANYPFTTLEPNLGVLDLRGIKSGARGSAYAEKDTTKQALSTRSEVVIADIPGLIEGASEGKGLGIQFLRHIERCQALMYVLYLEEASVFDEAQTPEEKASELYEQLQSLQQELVRYDAKLQELPLMVTISKHDLYDEELVKAIQELFAKKNIEITIWSGVTREGLDEVKKRIQNLLS